MKKSISVLVIAFLASSLSLTAQNHGDAAPVGEGAKVDKVVVCPMCQGQMMAQRGQMGKGQMMAQSGQMHRGRAQMRDGRPAFSKKNAKAFQKQAKRMRNVPMVNPEVRIKNQVERMTKQLDLTPEQASRIQDIQTKHFKKDIAKYKKYEKKRDARFKKRHGNLDEIKAVLTPEQIKKMDEMKEQAPRMQMRNGRMNGQMKGSMNGPMNGRN